MNVCSWAVQEIIDFLCHLIELISIAIFQKVVGSYKVMPEIMLAYTLM